MFTEDVFPLSYFLHLVFSSRTATAQEDKIEVLYLKMFPLTILKDKKDEEQIQHETFIENQIQML